MNENNTQKNHGSSDDEIVITLDTSFDKPIYGPDGALDENDEDDEDDEANG